MKFYGFIVAMQIAVVYSASKISIEDDNESIMSAAVNIIDRCFGSSSERWSELLIIVDETWGEIVKGIHHKSKTSNLALSLDNIFGNNEFTCTGKCNDHLNDSIRWRGIKTNAVIVTTYGPKHLDFLFRLVKNNFQRLWRPGSYFLIVIDTCGCDVAEFNDMFKVIWGYWILNAVIICAYSNTANWNQSEIELYTFNPYSGDHSPQWETIIKETVEVSIAPGNFNHSWYIFKQRFSEIRSSEYCSDLYFDKTSNLDGYVIPISVGYPGVFFGLIKSTSAKWFVVDKRMLETLAASLRFEFAQVFYKDVTEYGSVLENGSYIGPLDDVYKGRAHLTPTRRSIRHYPGLGTIYPLDRIGTCIASRIVGFRSRWTNLADARHVWIGLGFALLFFAVILYLQNKSQGIMSALLDAERLIIGSTIIHTSTFIKHRIILGSIFLVVLVLDGAIRGRFISILTVVKPYPNLETLEQVQSQGMELCGAKAFREQITDPQLKARYNINVPSDECIDSLDRGETHRACLADCLHVTYQAANLSTIHRASIPIWTRHATIVTTMHWPMTNRYSFQVQKLLEAGIYEKWRSDVARDSEVEGWKHNRALELPDLKPTKLNDLLPIFVLLFVGLLVTLITFAWEMKDSKIFRPVKSQELSNCL